MNLSPRFRPRVRIGTCIAVAALLLAVAGSPVMAQQPAEQWDVTQPRGQTREIDFTTQEGTWMAVDISPDGRWIVFDLLGHIYRVSVEGGAAECLTQQSGIAINFHPRYSPDGTEIAFVSDRRGQMNLWVMQADGSDAAPVFLDDGSRITEPTWTPDGRYIVATRNFPTAVGLWRRSAQIWMFPRAGGEGVELVGAPSGTQAYWPSIAPDGQSLFYFYATFAAVTTGYGYDHHIRRLDLRTGANQAVTAVISPREARAVYHSPDPSELAPEISPDGRWLAFARRMPGGSVTFRGHTLDERTALWLKDLHSGTERVLMDPITADMVTTHQMKNFSVVPRYAWAKDGESLVLSQGGKLRRVWVETGEVSTIPFTARVHRVISEQARSRADITDDPFDARFLQWMTASPDGRRLVFEAVGRLWTMDLPVGTPRRLTDGEDEVRELTPAWSPDGRWIAFATWDDEDGGHLWKMASGGGRAERLTEQSARYLYPEWSPDGQYLVVSRESGAVTGDRVSGVVRIPASGGSEQLLLRGSQLRPVFGAGSRIFVARQRASGPGRIQFRLEQGMPQFDQWISLVSVHSDGGDERDEVTFPYAQEVAPSPDGKWIAYTAGTNLFIAPFPAGRGAEGPVRIDMNAGRLPVTRVSTEGAFSPRWRDASIVEFGSGNRYFVYHVDLRQMDTVTVRLRVTPDIPDGTVALTGARIITLANREVIEDGTILVSDSRITCVGECDASCADRVFDLRGKTIVSGFVDTHAHHLGNGPIIAQHRSSSALYLAHGVTTTLDPAAPASGFPIAELTRAGKLVGPRVFSAGGPMNASPPSPPGGPTIPRIETYDDAVHYVNRLADWGAISVKQFLAPLRQQRQWLADAARKRGLSVTAEGAELYYEVSMIMDGHTGWEHPLPYAPIYNDAAEFFGRTDAAYSNTLVVASGGPWMEEYFRARSDLWSAPKHRRFLPWLSLARTREYAMRPVSGYRFPWVAEGFADIVRAGGHGALGGHGEEPGLDTHWELWGEAFALTPMEALEVASLGGAYMAGLEDDLGSVEVGKLADLLVLNSNPLDDIRRTVDLMYVMKGGTLYEAATLDEVWPDATPYGPIPWIDEGALRTDVVPIDIWDHDARRERF